MLNKLYITGQIASPPVRTYHPAPKPCSTVFVVNSTNNNQTTTIAVDVQGAQGDWVYQNLKARDHVTIEGNLHERGRDSALPHTVHHSRHYLLADRVHFIKRGGEPAPKNEIVPFTGTVNIPPAVGERHIECQFADGWIVTLITFPMANFPHTAMLKKAGSNHETDVSLAWDNEGSIFPLPHFDDQPHMPAHVLSALSGLGYDITRFVHCYPDCIVDAEATPCAG